MADDFLNILCPVDFSSPARTAVGYAAALAGHFRARLHVLAVTSDDDGSAGRRLEEFLAPIVSRFDALPAPILAVQPGAPGEVILQMAEERAADLIVISTHGAGNGASAYGSTTLHVMQHAAAPLLVIPPAMHAMPPPAAEQLLSRHDIILAPVDFHRRARYDVRIAAGLARAFSLDLLLLHVVSPADGHTYDDARMLMRDLVDEIGGGISTDTWIAAGDAAEEIGRVATARNAGLIVMGLRGDGAVRGTLPGSIAFEVLRRAPAIVLALPEGRERMSADRRQNGGRRAAADAPLPA